jgi:FkbM family methyltransferase
MKIPPHEFEIADRYYHELDRLLGETPSAAEERERSSFWRLAEPFCRRFVIFGAGQLGRKVADTLRRHRIEPLAFADNDSQLWGRPIDGIAVCSPADAAAQWGNQATFVISIWPSRASDTYLDRERQLRNSGCVNVIPFLPLLWTEPAACLPHFSLAAPHLILADAPLIRRCGSLWTDPASADAYLGILRWRLLADFSGIPARVDGEQYFPDDLFAVGPGDVLVDCGAFDGDTIRPFLRRVGDNECGVIALEPDPRNRAALQAFVASLGARGSSIVTVPCAAGRRRESLQFSATGTEMASVASAGPLTVEAVPLDELLADRSPSLIKMDIEGFELEALAGSVDVIRRSHPVIAVAVYHHSDHLWKVPLAIAAASTPEFDGGKCAKYSFFLRSYQHEFWETVCYAVPLRR